MDIQQLKYFVEAARQKNFTRASEILHVSQPSISKMIKGLEEELQVILLDRSERKVALTDAGHVVYDKALYILELVEDVRMSVREISEGETGTIRLGLMPTLGVLLFPDILAKFKKLYPKIELNLSEHSGKLLEQKVLSGELDMGVTVLPVDGKQFGTVTMLKEELIVIAPKDHWLSKHAGIELSQLKDESFILFTEEYVLHDLVMNACKAAGFEPKSVYESALWDIAGELVVSNFGISIVPRSIASRFEGRMIQVPIDTPKIAWEIGLIYKKDKYISYASRKFINYMDECDYSF